LEKSKLVLRNQIRKQVKHDIEKARMKMLLLNGR